MVLRFNDCSLTASPDGSDDHGQSRSVYGTDLMVTVMLGVFKGAALKPHI